MAVTLFVALHVGHRRFFVLLAKLVDFLEGLFDDALLARRRDHVVDADRDAGLGRVKEAHRLQVVEQRNRRLVAEPEVAESDERLQTLLFQTFR